MNGDPTLSIIVTAYNLERYIGQCLHSILAQLEARHELIVIDDGSADNTPVVIEQLRREHGAANMRTIRQANQGVATTRNNALAAATGRYILFVDGDDVLLPGSLAALDSIIAAHGPDVIACDFNMWYPGQEHKNCSVSLGYPIDVLIGDREAILRTFFADRHMYLCFNVFRRAIYGQLPAPVFPPNRAFEDISVLPSLLAGCASLVHLPHAIIDYRQHPTSITKMVSEKSCLDMAAALLQVKTRLESQAVGAQIELQADIAASYFYIGIVKNSYQLPWSRGREMRARLKASYLASLFNAPERVLDAMTDRTIFSNDSRQDAAIAGQVRKALAGSLAFDITKTISRTYKLWQQARKTRPVPA